MGFGLAAELFFRSNHIAELNLFSMFSLTLSFNFDLIYGSILDFWGPNGLFWGFEVLLYSITTSSFNSDF